MTYFKSIYCSYTLLRPLYIVLLVEMSGLAISEASFFGWLWHTDGDPNTHRPPPYAKTSLAILMYTGVHPDVLLKSNTHCKCSARWRQWFLKFNLSNLISCKARCKDLGGDTINCGYRHSSLQIRKFTNKLFFLFLGSFMKVNFQHFLAKRKSVWHSPNTCSW